MPGLFLYRADSELVFIPTLSISANSKWAVEPPVDGGAGDLRFLGDPFDGDSFGVVLADFLDELLFNLFCPL